MRLIVEVSIREVPGDAPPVMGRVETPHAKDALACTSVGAAWEFVESAVTEWMRGRESKG